MANNDHRNSSSTPSTPSTSTPPTTPAVAPPPVATQVTSKEDQKLESGSVQGTSPGQVPLTAEQVRAEEQRLARSRSRSNVNVGDRVIYNDNGEEHLAFVAKVHEPTDEDPDAGYVNLFVVNGNGEGHPKSKVRRGDESNKWSTEPRAYRQSYADRASSSASSSEQTPATPPTTSKTTR